MSALAPLFSSLYSLHRSLIPCKRPAVDPYKYHRLPDTTVTKGTVTIGSFDGISEEACWKKCVDMAEGKCKSAVHAKAVTPTSCLLLDSVAEHRLERMRMHFKATLLYPATRREMGLPLNRWQTADGSSTTLFYLGLRMVACMLLFVCMRSSSFSGPGACLFLSLF